MNKSRFMKLAGLLTEATTYEATEKLGNTRRRSTSSSTMNEAGVNTKAFKETMDYFKSIKEQIITTCDDTIAELKKPKPDADGASDAFSSGCLDLVKMDASFEDWYEWVLEGNEGRETPMFEKPSTVKSGLRSTIKYFEDIKKIVTQICDISLKGLQDIKMKGNTATSRDLAKVKSQIKPLLHKLSWDIDSSFERWENWCNTKVFKGIINPD